MAPEELFITLYRVLIGQESGPRAGWFLSLIDRKWLIKRLMLET
jgi:lysyl-tRNA synthetase class I